MTLNTRTKSADKQGMIKKVGIISALAAVAVIVIVVISFAVGTVPATGAGSAANMTEDEANSSLIDNWKPYSSIQYGSAWGYAPNMENFIMPDAPIQSAGLKSDALLADEFWVNIGLRPGVAVIFENADWVIAGQPTDGIVVFSFNWGTELRYVIAVNLLNFNVTAAANYYKIIYA